MCPSSQEPDSSVVPEASGNQARPWDDTPSFLSEGIQPEAMASFFAAAAALYRQAPWEQRNRLGPLFRLSCQAQRLRGWIGSLSGDSGPNVAITCFRSRQAHDRFVHLVQQQQQNPFAKREPLPESLVLTYQNLAELPPPLQAEIQQQQWPLVSPQACPLPLQIGSDLTAYPLSPRELVELELMVRGLSALLEVSTDSLNPNRQRLEVSLGGERLAISISLLHPSLPATSPPATVPPETAPPETAPAEQGQLPLAIEVASLQVAPADSTVAAPPAADGTSAPSSGSPAATARTPATAPTAAPAGERNQEDAYGRVPAALQEKVHSLMATIDPFCRERLTPEYRQLIQAALGALARKRPSPLLGGRASSWCAGIVHAVGTMNFLFDRSQTPHCKAPEIYHYFNVSAQTGQAHSKKVRDLLGMRQFHWTWILPSLWDELGPLWFLECNGFIQDARRLPLQVQIDAWQRGLIPYVPAIGREACLGTTPGSKGSGRGA